MAGHTESDVIKLSPYARALLESVRQIKPRDAPDDYTRLDVSRAVSFLALVYEKIRNAVEYREAHLLRRAAVERIIRRRLALNPTGRNEGEQIVRELLWARYFPKGSLGLDDADTVQHLVNRYLRIKSVLTNGKQEGAREYFTTYIYELLSCEIEESLSPDQASRERFYTYFLFQTLKNRVRVEGADAKHKDVAFFVALEKTYRKCGRPYLRYHLYELLYEPPGRHTEASLEQMLPRLADTLRTIDRSIAHPVVDRMARFVKRQLPPYMILFDILNTNPTSAQTILTSRAALWKEVESRCGEKYAALRKTTRDMTVRSAMYIFVMKLVTAALIEYPLSLLAAGALNPYPIVLNTLFPPALIFLIAATFRMPGKENTRRIYERIVQIINNDPSYENRVALVHKKQAARSPLLNAVFSALYGVALGLMLYGIHIVLSFLNFNLISQVVFVFFLSVAAFFSYRIRQQINELVLVERESILRPLFDFFIVPLVAVGKVFNSTVSRINFLTVILDFLIETPFKLIIDVIEEWISFMRRKREDIV